MACTHQSLSHFQLSVTLWTLACQAPLSIEFFRQEYWTGLPFSSSREPLDPGIKPASPVPPALQVNSLPAKPSGKQNPGNQGRSSMITAVAHGQAGPVVPVVPERHILRTFLWTTLSLDMVIGNLVRGPGLSKVNQILYCCYCRDSHILSFISNLQKGKVRHFQYI